MCCAQVPECVGRICVHNKTGSETIVYDKAGVRNVMMQYISLNSLTAPDNHAEVVRCHHHLGVVHRIVCPHASAVIRYYRVHRCLMVH